MMIEQIKDYFKQKFKKIATKLPQRFSRFFALK